MDCGCVNTGISIYFQCRILAAKNNVYLKSRESAAEYFGISVSSLANYERGITVPPLDMIMMMADVYGAPQLKNLYCLEQCPLGKQQPVSAEIKTLEAVTVGIIAKLDEKDIEEMRRELLEIAEDGKISPDEEDDFTAVSKELDKLAVSISELRLIKEKLILVAEKMYPVWEKALAAGPFGQPIMDAFADEFVFDTHTASVLSWINERGADFITAVTQEQKKAIKAMLARHVDGTYTVW